MEKIQSKVAFNVIRDKLKKLYLTFDSGTKRNYDNLEKRFK
jgi:hypothetical protein